MAWLVVHPGFWRQWGREKPSEKVGGDAEQFYKIRPSEMLWVSKTCPQRPLKHNRETFIIDEV